MSSKKFVYFLVISFVCGLIVSGVAHASIVGIKGIVSDAEGSPLAGVKVTAPDFGEYTGNLCYRLRWCLQPPLYLFWQRGDKGWG